MNNPLRMLILGSVVLAACGRDVTPTSVKFAGVGLRPDEVGPTPTNFGGVIELDYVNFSGGGLPLGLLGLLSYDEVGPAFAQMKPPYGLIYGLGFIMEQDLPATDTLFGTFGMPPEVEGACYTNFEPRAYLNNTSDVGDAITFVSENDGIAFGIGRRPSVYPLTSVESLFAYYSELDVYQPEALVGTADVGTGTFTDAPTRVIRAANWKHGAPVAVTFPGGLPPEDANVGSIPMPLVANEATTTTLPLLPQGVMLSWTGPQYDNTGAVVQTGEVRTCLQFLAHPEAPAAAEDCLSLAEPPDDGSSFAGQMYTGPWDTNGGVTLSWVQPEGADASEDIITVSVRFLGPVDFDDENKLVSQVPVGVSDEVIESWEDYANDGLVPEGSEPPEGVRAALACEEEGVDFSWERDPALFDDNGNLIVSMQGEPTHTLSDVTCHVPSAATSFTITDEMIADARDYALRNNAEGAIFYLTRMTILDIDTPPVRDRFGQKRDISDVRVLTRSVELGRFWFNL
jgi:hypothetical protein